MTCFGDACLFLTVGGNKGLNAAFTYDASDARPSSCKQSSRVSGMSTPYAMPRSFQPAGLTRERAIPDRNKARRRHIPRQVFVELPLAARD